MLTKSEKETIRNSPCGRCGAVPPFKDGSRCHPHRIIPRSQGGLYTRENTVPRCPKCHGTEHGGMGRGISTAALIGAAHLGGRSGGKLGGKRRQELYPDLSRQWGLKYGREAGIKGGHRTHELHPDHGRQCGLKYGSKGGHRVHELYPNLAHENGSKYFGNKAGRLGRHMRWHVHRGVVNPQCELCAKRST